MGAFEDGIRKGGKEGRRERLGWEGWFVSDELMSVV